MDRDQIIRQQARRYDSFYLYDQSHIADRCAQLKTDFPNVDFLYSLKANPARRVLTTLFRRGFGADAASLNEVRKAHAGGLSPADIHYSAPGKSLEDIRDALHLATLVADSLGELDLLQTAAADLNMTADIGLRINPDFTFAGDGGVPSKFGMDEGDALAVLDRQGDYPNLRIIGIHVHVKSQELDGAVLEGYYERMFALAERVRDKLGRPLAFMNLGSGLGIPYSDQDLPLDTRKLGQKMASLMEAFREKLGETRVILETGRFVVGQSGVYVTKVMDRKTSHGKTFLLLKNTLNGFLRPSIARLVLKYAGEGPLPGSEPLFTGPAAFQFRAVGKEGDPETVTLMGNLCTAMDVVAEDIALPRLDRGDLLEITNAGSYAAVLSPMQFSTQAAPVELMLLPDGGVVLADESW